MQTLDYITRRVVRLNEEGVYYPLWGTCLGFEAILTSLSNFTLKRHKIQSVNHTLKLKWNPKAQSKYFYSLPSKILKGANDKKINYFNHIYGIFECDIRKNPYLKDISIIATSKTQD